MGHPLWIPLFALAAAGALIGSAVGGGNQGAVIGGTVGGGVATGVVAASDGYQVVLKSGTPLTFTTSEAVAVRRQARATGSMGPARKSNGRRIVIAPLRCPGVG